MIKVSSLLAASDDWTREEFQRRWILIAARMATVSPPIPWLGGGH